MPESLFESYVFYVNPNAKWFHERGLEFEKQGNYPAAHNAFERGIAVLDDAPESAHRSVQLGRIKRDDGFTYARSAIEDHDISKLDRADEVLAEDSDFTTVPINQTLELPSGFDRSQPLNLVQTRELYAEHGATTSLVGRVATIREVVFGGYDKPFSAHNIYTTADMFLKKGSNGYYMVSNAMVAARHERVDNNLPALSYWLGQGAVNLAWTSSFDRKNLKPAVRTFANRMRHLRTHLTALDSVSEKP